MMGSIAGLPLALCQKRPINVKRALHTYDVNDGEYCSKETYYESLKCQKRPTMEANESCYRSK
jgi:hypothetical protein